MKNLSISVVVSMAVFVAALTSHYHLVFFGDDELYNLYVADEQFARDRLQPLWPYGRVWIGFAEWSGIHYVTKYVLKDDESNFNRSVPSFTISSKGLGMAFLNSPEADEIRKRLQYLKYNFKYVFAHCPVWYPDDVDSIKAALEYYRRFVPNFKVQLESGKWVMLPRVIRKKFLGTYEVWSDNVLWEYQELQECLKMNEYLDTYGGTNFAAENSEKTIDLIRKRLIKISHDKKLKKLSRL